jgi:phytoene dehydrogenase-like protein
VDGQRRERPTSVQAAVVGAGLAGLVCARALARAGRDVHIFEAAEEIGGKMRTEIHREGFRLDHGFHVFLTGYPSVRKEIDLAKLDIRAFQPGCVVFKDGRFHPLSETAEALRFPLATLGDKLRLRRLRSADPGKVQDRSTLEHLRSLGFSGKCIESLFRPLFGGVFLDRSLSNSSRYFASIMRAFFAGPVGIPRNGINTVPALVASEIPPGSIHLGCPVDAVRVEGRRIVGLTVGGQEINAETVILACGASEAARLSGLEVAAPEARGMTVVYYTTAQPPTQDARLFIRGDAEGVTNHFAVLTNVAPELAPAGQHLLMGAILGVPEDHDGAIADRVRDEMAWWFPHGMTHTWRWLRTFKLPAAQWAYPPGTAAHLPQSRTGIDGLLLAGDITEEPSVDGAIRSGLAAAESALGM